jgi:hypothetical protein
MGLERSAPAALGTQVCDQATTRPDYASTNADKIYRWYVHKLMLTFLMTSLLWLMASLHFD